MSIRTYFVAVDGGHTDPNLVSIRKLAMDYLWTHPEDGQIIIYSSRSKRQIVGKVVFNSRASPIFAWSTPRKSIRTLYRDGNIYKKPN